MSQRDDLPWYRRVTRWGQINITEIDPTRYDIGWWRNYWKETGTEGVVVNAGGIVAYYPAMLDDQTLSRRLTYFPMVARCKSIELTPVRRCS
jgi:hypothetical protein